MNDKNRLELRWNGKDLRESLEPRILINKKPFGAPSQASKNLLLHADNLLGLKSIEHKYVNKIKCIYIDPPYNTKSLFPHYNDSMEHSLWLNMMKERLIILHRLLRADSSIWISIDDSECHYLKVMCDEIFGRENFVESIVWERAYAPINLKKTLSKNHDYILVYAKNIQNLILNKLPRTENSNDRYKNPDNDCRGVWDSDNLSVGPISLPNHYAFR